MFFCFLAPQALAFFEPEALPVSVVQSLESVRFEPCLCLMASFDRPTLLKEQNPSAVQGFVNGVAAEPVSWIADNQGKGVRTTPVEYATVSIVMHSLLVHKFTRKGCTPLLSQLCA